jgi:hypothetical protein
MTSGEATWEGSTLKAFCSFVAFPEYGGNGSPTDTTGLALLDPPAIHALLTPPWDGDRTTALPASIATLACVRGGMAYDAHSCPLAGFVWLRLSHHAVQGLPRSRQCHRDCFVNS